MAVVAGAEGKVEFLDHDDGARLLDERAREHLGISGAEFIQRWEAGEYAADPDRPEIMRVAMLLPFAH